MNFTAFTDLFIKKEKEPDYFFLKGLPQTEYGFWLRKIYRIRTGLVLNLENPKRFNEKIQYIKLYDDLESKFIYTDKVLIRNYYLEKIGSDKHLKGIIGVYNSFDEIDFDSLPNEFIILVNHGCKMSFKVTNKSLMPKEKGRRYLKNLFDGWLGYNFAYCAGFEMQYKNIQPKIIIEKLYKNNDNSRIKEIMFFCFNGQPKYTEMLINGRKHELNQICFYDLNWNPYDCGTQYIYPPSPSEKPACYNEMFEISKKLAAGFKFVRVDFMLINDDFYFLELTLTPNSGFVRFKPDKYDFIFGSFLNL